MRNRLALLAVALILCSAIVQGQAKKPTTAAAKPATSASELVLSGKIDEAVKLALQSPVAAESALNALMARADTQIVNFEVDKAMITLDAAQKFMEGCDKAGGPKKLPREALLGRHFRIQGIIFNNNREFAQAQAVLKQALQFSKNAQDPALEAGIRNNMGYALQNLKQLEDASKEFDAARKIAEQQKDDLRAGSYNFNLGVVLLDMEQPERAVEAFKRAETQNKTAGRAVLEARSMLMQGVALGRIDTKSGDALKLFGNAESMFEKIGDTRNAGWSFYLMADHMQNSMDYKKAAEFGEKAVPFLTKAVDNAGLKACYELLTQLYGNMGDKTKAESYKKLADDLAAKK
jgi:tetratricopeptide (TPR) repeat protein